MFSLRVVTTVEFQFCWLPAFRSAHSRAVVSRKRACAAKCGSGSGRVQL